MLEETIFFLEQKYDIKRSIIEEVDKAEKDCAEVFAHIDSIAFHNQAKVLDAFQKERIAAQHFAQTNGYGYDDIGRDALDRVFARIFSTEDALVRPHIASGTHALSLALHGLLKPGDEMLCVSGKPYDTLEDTIGLNGESWGSLAHYGISYCQVELNEDDDFDIAAILESIRPQTRMVYLQRSRGYSWRRSLSIAQIKKMCDAVKAKHRDILIMADNCYGEFSETLEPPDVGVDVIAGSLIKNPGGGLAATGAYIAGDKRSIEKIASRLTSAGIGREVGSYAGGYRNYYQGIFLAPHVTAQAQKGAVLAARIYERRGFTVLPQYDELRSDIIQSLRFDTEEQLIHFCQAIQAASPIESHVKPEPWAMPGYSDPVIMAAGAFVQGASIELSADAPIREPYIAYMQGGLTYEHVKMALLMSLQALGK